MVRVCAWAPVYIKQIIFIHFTIPHCHHHHHHHQHHFHNRHQGLCSHGAQVWISYLKMPFTWKIISQFIVYFPLLGFIIFDTKYFNCVTNISSCVRAVHVRCDNVLGPKMTLLRVPRIRFQWVFLTRKRKPNCLVPIWSLFLSTLGVRTSQQCIEIVWQLGNSKEQRSSNIRLHRVSVARSHCCTSPVRDSCIGCFRVQRCEIVHGCFGYWLHFWSI